MVDLSPNLLKQPRGLGPSRLENDPLWHDLVSYSHNLDKIQIVTLKRIIKIEKTILLVFSNFYAAFANF